MRYYHVAGWALLFSSTRRTTTVAGCSHSSSLSPARLVQHGQGILLAERRVALSSGWHLSSCVAGNFADRHHNSITCGLLMYLPFRYFTQHLLGFHTFLMATVWTISESQSSSMQYKRPQPVGEYASSLSCFYDISPRPQWIACPGDLTLTDNHHHHHLHRSIYVSHRLHTR